MGRDSQNDRERCTDVEATNKIKGIGQDLEGVQDIKNDTTLERFFWVLTSADA